MGWFLQKCEIKVTQVILISDMLCFSMFLLHLGICTFSQGDSGGPWLLRDSFMESPPGEHLSASHPNHHSTRGSATSVTGPVQPWVMLDKDARLTQ